MPSKMPTSSFPLLGPILRRARIRRGLSQTQVALTMGVPRSYISKVETGGTQPTIGSLVRIGQAMGYDGWRILWAAEQAYAKTIEQKGAAGCVPAKLSC